MRNTLTMRQHYRLKLLLFCFVSYFHFLSAYGQKVARAGCEKVETEAYFQNGNEDWTTYLYHNVTAKIPSLRCAPAGTFCVEVRFLVGKDGSLADIKPLTKLGYGMEEEVVRVVKGAPDWIPATQNGKKCRAYKCADYVFEVKEPEGNLF